MDVLMVERGLARSREKAQALLMAGSVSVDGMREWKPGTRYAPEAVIEVAEDPVPYVGRGGLKLKAAIDAWGIDPAGLVCMDIGASTGGFTDVLLKEGAAKVYAVDVGYGQLDFTLRNDARVVNMERTNIRFLDTEAFPEKVDFVVIDVAFISLALVLPVAVRVMGVDPGSAPGMTDGGPGMTMDAPGMTEGGPGIVCLVKPQFEAGRAQVGKGGIVRDPAVHAEVVENVKNYAKNLGLDAVAVMDSPVLGAKGNKEFLLWLR
ncbi:MAG: TlyA family RNA methyltransferase [Clostridiales Family XIII bacterium]|nr:TlyA family RNA methyltransferase [Clostridiales Family XIII bacterium]